MNRANPQMMARTFSFIVVVNLKTIHACWSESHEETV
jgi:hypothetical protein